NHPVNLNTASIADLTIVPYFDLSIAQVIIEHRNKYGPFFSVNELYTITSIPENVIRKSLVFLTTSIANQNANVPIKNNSADFSIKLRARILSNLHPTIGFKENIFKGSQDKTYGRLKINYGNNITAGLLIEKDAGELSYTDFSSGFLNITGWMNISNIIIGDYVPQFGQGLALWSAYGFAKSSNAIYSDRKYSSCIKPYSSAAENNFFRGVAVEKKWEHVQLTGFFSTNFLDANIDSTSGLITSIPIDGLHRTSNEINKRKSAVEIAYGITLKSDLLKPFTLGILYYNSRFNHPIYSGNFFDVNEYNFNYYSSYYDLYLKNFNIFGEITFDGKSTASINGLNYSPSPDFTYTLSIRQYPKDHISLHGYSFGEQGGKVKNEIGIYNGIQWNTSIGDFNFYYDQFKFPFAKYDNPMPSEGNELMLNLNINPKKKLEITLKYKQENKEVIQEVNKQDELVKRLKQSFRTEFTYSPLRFIRYKTRLEYVKLFIRSTDNFEEGYLIYQDMRIRPIDDLMIYCRAIFFNTNSFNSAVYEYENDLTGILNCVGLYGEGMRIYIVLRYNFTKEASLSLKYSETYKPGETSLGTGNYEIMGNIDNRIGLQLDLNL
ncbi:MAG TPA: helix-hairpin-helix domain-containing protein, partial [Ignavibacteriaceae bacterium]|nr:helix-hairpin-helix domain-containing protein [Ignavibacteriaceae bacterium]